jgi:hypothetical protein
MLNDPLIHNQRVLFFGFFVSMRHYCKLILSWIRYIFYFPKKSKEKKMKKIALFLSTILLYSSSHVVAADNLNDKLCDEWVIVPHVYRSEHTTNEEDDDLELSLKAFGNTALSILGGIGTTACEIGLNVFERTLQQQANQFSASVTRGSNFVGGLYGQGMGLRNAYDYEKNLLKKKN